MQQHSANGNCIIVIPFDWTTFEVIEKRLVVYKLYFWHDDSYDHAVNEQNLNLFLLQLKMFKPTIYPNAQELKCCALNVPFAYQHGEAGVHQIHYKGQVVYCRC
jgi:hypothetical protein